MSQFSYGRKLELSTKTYDLNFLLSSSELKFNKFRGKSTLFSHSLTHKKYTTRYLINRKTASSES